MFKKFIKRFNYLESNTLTKGKNLKDMKEHYNLKTVKTAEDDRDLFKEDMEKEAPPEENFE